MEILQEKPTTTKSLNNSENERNQMNRMNIHLLEMNHLYHTHTHTYVHVHTPNQLTFTHKHHKHIVACAISFDRIHRGNKLSFN